jgi:LacI family transcriptional regulator
MRHDGKCQYEHPPPPFLTKKPPMSTMRDVAALASVSAKTVSRVFNDDPHVLPETRARVEAALRQLNYVPNSLARNFREGRASTIGIAVPDLEDPFFAAIVKSVDRLAVDRGLSTVVTSLGDDAHREHDLIESLLRQQLAGIVIVPISGDHAYLQPWVSRVPMVFVDRAPVRLAVDSFIEDDFDGAFVAVRHLLDHGHRRIAFIGDTFEIPTNLRRLDGYHAALAEYGVEPDPALVTAGVLDRAGAVRAISSIVASSAPTAVFASNARSSIALIPAIRGTTLAFVGFGDFPMADMLTPAVTVIDQDPAALGALATQRLFDRIDAPQRRFRRRTVLPVRLVERESCRVEGFEAPSLTLTA